MARKPGGVDIFIGPIACTCAGGPTPARQEMISRAFALQRELESTDERFEVRTWRLGDESDYAEGIALLGRYLLEAGEDELAGHLAYSLNEATPAVAVDGRLVAVRRCPGIDELLEPGGEDRC